MALSDTPVVCLLGARQCGKSTLAARLVPDRYFVNLDDAAFRKLAQEDPQVSCSLLALPRQGKEGSSAEYVGR